MRPSLPSPILLLALFTGCQGQVVDRSWNEPTFLQVELATDVATGSPEDLLPFSSEYTEIGLVITTLDHNADPHPFEGELTLKVRPGLMEGNPTVTVVEGRYEGSVQIRNGFGPTRITATEDGGRFIDEGETPSFATGVTEAIYYQFPTLAEMNLVEEGDTVCPGAGSAHEQNQLCEEFAEIRCEDRQVTVTALAANGFWVTDLADAAGEFNALFIYTFQAPGEDIELGRRLTLLNGNNQEYLATTQVSFPTYEVADEEPVSVPEPSVLASSLCPSGSTDANHQVLEGFESATVTLENVVVPSSFASTSDEDYLDYIEYGQWPVAHAGENCSFYVSSASSCPDFRPEADLTLEHVTGQLSEVWGKWILNIRSAADLPDGHCENAPDGPPRRPQPRPRPVRTP